MSEVRKSTSYLIMWVVVCVILIGAAISHQASLEEFERQKTFDQGVATCGPLYEDKMAAEEKWKQVWKRVVENPSPEYSAERLRAQDEMEWAGKEYDSCTRLYGLPPTWVP